MLAQYTTWIILFFGSASILLYLIALLAIILAFFNQLQTLWYFLEGGEVGKAS